MMIFCRPKCEWIRRPPHSTASMTGFSDPAAKGATLSGTRPSAMARSKVQWYEPWVGECGGTIAGSLTRWRRWESELVVHVIGVVRSGEDHLCLR